MGRCYSCCQENCAYTTCTCSCHDGDDYKKKNKKFDIDKKMKEDGYRWNSLTCDWEHTEEHGEKMTEECKCFNTISGDGYGNSLVRNTHLCSIHKESNKVLLSDVLAELKKVASEYNKKDNWAGESAVALAAQHLKIKFKK